MKAKEILTELDAAAKRLGEQVIVDTKAELASNIYPLLRLVIRNQQRFEREMDERMELCEESVAEMLAGAEDRIHDRLGARIQATVQLGLDICARLAQEATPEKPLAPELAMLLMAYRDSSGVLLGMVEDVLVSTEEEEDDEDGADEESDDEEEETDERGDPDRNERGHGAGPGSGEPARRAGAEATKEAEGANRR